MPCYSPVSAWYSAHKNPSGKRSLVFSAASGLGVPLKVPCLGCIGCRLEHSRQWALRCMHESSRHYVNSFLTLTYSDANLPAGGSLDARHTNLFMKRLRRSVGDRIRYFLCGEYGDATRRPHYHALVFGWMPSDGRLHKKGEFGDLYVSPWLDSVWGLGHCSFGAVTFQSAAYVARYALKKMRGKLAGEHYRSVDPETGEIHQLVPEYIRMSRNLGVSWAEQYKSDLYPDDFALSQGKRLRIPRAYDKRLPETELQELKLHRKKRASKFASENTPERLKVRRIVKLAQISTLKRTL